MKNFKSITSLLLGLSLFLLTAGNAQANFLSSSYEGQVGVAVSAYPTSYNPGPGTLSVSGLPAGATILSATLYSENYFASPSMTATFAGTALGSGAQFASAGTALQGYRWDVTSLVAGNGNYSATYAGGSNTYGLTLAVVYSAASLPSNGRVQILAGAYDVCGVSGCSVTDQFSNFGAGAGTLWIHTGADDSSSSGESINFNGTVVGGPINANLGPNASLFSLSVGVIAGANSINITSGGDQFDWNLAVLYGPASGSASVPEPATLLLLGLGLAGLAGAGRFRK